MADGFDHLEEAFDFRLRAVELDDQHRLGLRKIRMDRRFGSFDRQPVHHLDGGGNDARRNDFRYRRPGGLGRRKGRENRLDRLGHAQNPQRHFRDDRERAFRTHEHTEDVDARRVERGPAEMDHLAVGKNGLDAQDVMNGEAVLQAVRAA